MAGAKGRPVCRGPSFPWVTLQVFPCTGHLSFPLFRPRWVDRREAGMKEGRVAPGSDESRRARQAPAPSLLVCMMRSWPFRLWGCIGLALGPCHSQLDSLFLAVTRWG